MPILNALPWAEFISTIYRDEYYFPLDGSFRTSDYFKKTDSKDVIAGWEKTLDLIQEGIAPPEIGLYVHWPFCPSHCTFCRCSMTVPKSQKDMELAVEAVKDEMSLFRKTFRGVAFSSLYMGGGTPTFMADGMLDDFLSHLRNCFEFVPEAQIYTESSPSTLTPSKVGILARHGINRITVGIQTFDEDLLKKIDRQGQSKKKIFDIFEALSRLPAVVTDVDLMIGMEGQMPSIFIKDLEETLRLRPNCLHLYPFEEAPQTLYRKSGKRLSARDWAREKRLVELTDHIVGQAGYRRWSDRWNDLSLYPWETWQESARRRFRGSILGIGRSALSRAFGSLCYCHPPLFSGPGSNREIPPFLSLPSDLEEEMRGYVIEVLARSGKMSREGFRRLFKDDVLNVSFLAEPIAELGRLSLVGVNEEFISWTGNDSVERAVQLKRFYSSRVIEAILKARVMEFKDFTSQLAKGDVSWKKKVALDQGGHDTLAYYDSRFWRTLANADVEEDARSCPA